MSVSEMEARVRARLAQMRSGEGAQHQGGQASNVIASYPRTAAEIAMEATAAAGAQARAEAERRRLEESNRLEMIRREIESQNALGASFDPDVNLIADKFFTVLMRRIDQEFGSKNPSWDSLGAREKLIWLEATRIVLDELRKEPVPGEDALSKIARRRIIQ